jgi:hypothetical protein
MAKENANPQIFEVSVLRAHTRCTPLKWSQLGTFRNNDGDDDDPPLPKTRQFYERWWTAVVPPTAEVFTCYDRLD